MREQRRMMLIHRGTPTRIMSDDRVVLDFEKQTVEFVRDGATIGILPRHGRLTSNIEIMPFDHGCATVFLLILHLCTGMGPCDSEPSMERVVLTLHPSKREDGFIPWLIHKGCRTTLQTGDRVRINWKKPSFAFLRGSDRIWMKNAVSPCDDDVIHEIEIDEPVPQGALLMTIWQSLELFTDLRVERVASSYEDATFELTAP